MRILPFLLLLVSSLSCVDRPLGAQTPVQQAYTHPPQLQNGEELQPFLVQLYPDHLQELGIGGRIDLRLEIDGTGTITHSAIHRTSGLASLDSAALELVPKMRFGPARNGDVSVPLAITFPVRFNPVVPAEHRPQRADYGPSVLNERQMKGRLGKLCRRNSRVDQTSVKLLIGADGGVKSVEFLEPSGWRGLDRVALEIVYRARFAPARTRSGMPVGSWLIFSFECTA